MGRTILSAMAIMCGLVALCGLAGAGDVWYVDDDAPADFSTIQAAIDAASDGDTIIVRDGYYTGEGNRDIDFKGKAVHLKSENGPENCIIDCQQQGRAFKFHTGEDENSILDGFTITGGYERLGGGILCDTCSPTIVNNIISGNEAYVQGGGIMSYTASAWIIGNIVTDNAAISELGTHWTYGSGGGIFCDRLSAPVIMANIIARNVATNNGAGICCENHPTVQIVNNTIAHNTAGGKGGGIYSWSGAVVTVTNSILWGNRAENGNEIALRGSVSGTENSSLVVSYSDVAGGENSVYVEPGGELGWGSGNIDADPLFADPENSDFHLKSKGGRWNPATETWIADEVTSPCVDAGDPASDVPYEPEPNGNIRNMGAYGNTAEASKTNCPSLTVRSHPLSSLSIMGDHPGNTPYAVGCEEGELVELALDEPLSIVSDDQLYKFAYWVIDGVPKPHEATTVTVSIDGHHTATAVYNLFADANGDCAVNVLDLIFVRNRLGLNPNTGDNWRADVVTGDGAINVLDLIAVRNYLGTKCGE